jgi:hypothetical protein
MSKWMPVLVRDVDYLEVVALVAEREAGRADGGVDLHVDLVAGEPQVSGQGAGRRNGQAPVEVAAHLETHAGLGGEDPRLLPRPSWSIEALKQLLTDRTKTGRRWVRALDVCATARDNGELWLPTSEVASRTGMTVNQWRDACRKISPHLDAAFSGLPMNADGQAVWPLGDKSEFPGSGGEVWWAISLEMAVRWRQVRGDAFGVWDDDVS